MSDPIMVYIGMPLIKGIVILGVLLLTVAYLTFAERKFLGYMQVRLGPNRVGPKGWLQPIADGLKLFTKEDLVPGRAERFVFMLAPILIFAPAILVWAVIPFGEAFTIGGVEIQPFLADINIAVLFVLAVSTIGVYGIILGGWASNNKFSLMGGLRSAAQMVSYEVPMGFAVVSVLLMAGTLSLVGIVEAQRDFGLWFIFPGILGFGIYFVCGVAETNRNPFDLPEAEAELVAGFHTEYSGMKFAFFYLAEYANMLVVSSLAVILFFGGWNGPAPDSGFLSGLMPVMWFFFKTWLLLFVFIWVRATLPRMRYDQLMTFGWKRLIPASLGWLVLVTLATAIRRFGAPWA